MEEKCCLRLFPTKHVQVCGVSQQTIILLKENKQTSSIVSLCLNISNIGVINRHNLILWLIRMNGG